MVLFNFARKTQNLRILRGQLNQNVIFCVQFFFQKLFLKITFFFKTVLLKTLFLRNHGFKKTFFFKIGRVVKF